METPEDLVITASKITPEKKMGALSSKENRARVSDLCNNDDQEVVDTQIIDLHCETALIRGSDSQEREKTRVTSSGSDSFIVCSEENKEEIKSTGGEEKVDGENNFCVGDFVWGKIKTHKWWPGRVSGFDEGRVSVTFFGYGSSSSCSPSELIPFAENFCEISKVSSSKSFVNAVFRAVEELSSVVESNMSCKCARRAVENQGVVILGVDSNRLSIPKYEPYELLGKLTELATKGEIFLEGALEIAVLKSRLSAFYNFKGGYAMPVYCEPCHVQGLEDPEEKEENGVKKNGEVSVHLRGPLSTTPDRKASRKRKEKSVAELILPEENENTETKRVRKEKSVAELILPEENENTETKRVRKEKSVAELILPEENENTERKRVRKEKNQARLVSGKRKEIHVSDDEVLATVFTPRERKKSKYLCPPYTDLTMRIGNISSVKIESKVEHDKKKLSDNNCKVDELLSEIRFAAVDPFYLSEKGSLDTVEAFIAALKRSTYLHGSNYKTLRKCIRSRSPPKKVLSPLNLTKEESDASCDEDDLISDAGLIGQKVKILTSILEKCHSRLAAEEKSSLKDDLKLLLEKVEAVSEKVRAMAKNTSS